MADIVLIKENFKVPRNVWKFGKVIEILKVKAGNTRGAKLPTVSSSGVQQNFYRSVQKLILFKIFKSNFNSNENHDDGHRCNNERPARRAAVQGEQLRKTRDYLQGHFVFTITNLIPSLFYQKVLVNFLHIS